MMKKLPFLSILSLLMVLALTACGTQPPVEPPPAESPDTAAPAVEQPPDTNTDALEVDTGTEGYPEPQAPKTADAPAAYPAAEVDAGGVRTFTIVSESSNASYIVAETFLENATERLGIDPGLVDTVGTTEAVNGQLTLDFSEGVALQSGEFVVDISALKSDQSRRDQTIQERWLESASFPLATFTASRLDNFPTDYVVGEPVTFQLVGELTIREITQPVTFEVTATLEGDTISGVASAPLTMTDFGFDPPNFGGLFTVEDDFTVEVNFMARES